MKFIKLVILISILFGVYLDSNAQSAVNQYAAAKTFFENGDTSQCLKELQNCQESLGGSNAKIESLKCQALMLNADWVNAGIAYANYERLLPASAKNGEAYNMMLENKKEIWRQLEEIEKKKKEEQKQEIKKDLAIAESEAKKQEIANDLKIKKINTQNEEQLYSISMSSKDKGLLDLYKKEIGETGENFKKIQIEIEKKNNPTSFLTAAIKADDLIDFKYLVSAGGDLKYKNQKGESLLHLAIVNDAFKIFDELTKNNTGIEEVDLDGNTPLIKAVINNKVRFFDLLLLKGASLTKVNSVSQQPPFYYALLKSNVVIGEKMIRKGISPNAYIVLKNGKFTPLYLAVYQTQNKEFVEFLIKSGADINLASEGGITPLMAAVENKNIDLAGFLLNNDANINLQNESRQTALHLAVEGENSEMIVYLIQRGGADKKIKDSSNKTPLKIAKDKGDKEIVKAVKENKSYIDISSNYIYHEDQYIAKTEKVKKRNAIISSRQDRFFITYVYDSICIYGVSMGGLKQHGIGLYVTLRANEDILKSTSQNGKVNNDGDVSGGQFENWGNDWRCTNKTKIGVGEGVLGITKKITYPLWIYGGVGASYSQTYWQMDLYDNNGKYYDTDWLKNTDEKKVSAVVESGFILDLKGFNIRAGAKTEKFKEFILSFGVGFSI